MFRVHVFQNMYNDLEGEKGMMDSRDEQGRFLVGAPSANPGGRPALDPAVKAKLQDLTPRAVERLEEVMNGADPRLAMLAAVALLDRALGRPAQAADIRVSHDDELRQGHLAALVEASKRRALLQRERETAAVNVDVDVQLVTHTPELPTR